MNDPIIPNVVLPGHVTAEFPVRADVLRRVLTELIDRTAPAESVFPYPLLAASRIRLFLECAQRAVVLTTTENPISTSPPLPRPLTGIPRFWVISLKGDPKWAPLRAAYDFYRDRIQQIRAF